MGFIMKWYYCFYVDAKTGKLFRNYKTLMKPDALANFKSAKVYDGDSHILHKAGSLIKNHGLRTSIIVELSNETESTLFSLSPDCIFNIPSEITLQAIFEIPDIDELKSIIQPIVRFNSNHIKRKNDNSAIQLIKKQIDRLVSSFCDINDYASDDYKKALSVYVNESKKEIDRINKKTLRESSNNKQNIEKLKWYLEDKSRIFNN